MSTEDLILEAIKGPQRMTEGIEITPSKRGSRLIDFEDIEPRKSKRTIRIPKSVDEWNVKHFTMHMRRLHRERYDKDWRLNFGAVCHEVNQINDFIVEIKGECSNKTMYAYITWFFENCCDDMVNKHGSFYPSQLRDGWVMDRFYDSGQVKAAKSEKTAKKQKPKISKEEMEASMLLGINRFVVEYGIVIAVNWCLKHEGMEPNESAKEVFFAMKDAEKQGLLGKVIESTELYSPYPKLPFTKANWLLSKVNPELTVDISTTSKEAELRKILV